VSCRILFAAACLSAALQLCHAMFSMVATYTYAWAPTRQPCACRRCCPLLCQAGKKHYCINGRVLKKGKAAVDEECETLLKDGCCPYHGKGKENLISHHSIGVSMRWSAYLPPPPFCSLTPCPPPAS
jgi:hypothetical protein